MAQILKGAPVAAAIDAATAERSAALAERGIVPTIAILRVGEREDDVYYENAAAKRCGKLGINVVKFTLPATVSQQDVIDCVEKINSDDSIHGALIFRPMPKSLDEEAVRQSLRPEKDIDGITDISMAGVFTGTKSGFAPCTAQSCMEILKFYGIDPKGKKAVVLGRSLVIGRPVAMMLMEANATVTICHTRTENISIETKNADIVIAAVGRAKVAGEEYFRAGQVVLDVGMNALPDGKMCGDVDFEAAEKVVSAITPVPGGVGSVTTSVLLRHVVEAAERK